MIENLERMFPGFKLEKNHGKADRERYILEFSKKVELLPDNHHDIV